MEDEIYEQIIHSSKKPYFPPTISSKTHIIFLKYSSPKYRAYIISQYKILCDKLTNEGDQREIFYLSLLYNDIILYNCGNEPIISNLYLLIFCCFYLSIKTRKCQCEALKIHTIKKLNQEKFTNYTSKEIREVEVLCLKLLKYKLDYTTAYDLISLHILKNNGFDKNILKNNLVKNIIDFSVEFLNDLIESDDISDYIFRSPLKLAQEIYNMAKAKMNTEKNYEDKNFKTSLYKSIKLKNSNINDLNTFSDNQIMKYEKKTNKNNIEDTPILFNTNTQSTNNSSILKNNSGEKTPTTVSFNNTSKINEESNSNNNINKAVFMDPIYSVSSSSTRINNKFYHNKKENYFDNVQLDHSKKSSYLNNSSMNFKEIENSNNGCRLNYIKDLVKMQENSTLKATCGFLKLPMNNITKCDKNISRYLINVNAIKKQRKEKIIAEEGNNRSLLSSNSNIIKKCDMKGSGISHKGLFHFNNYLKNQ